MLLGASRAIEYLHCHAEPGIIHRDVKSLNILFDANWVPRLSDFNLSVSLQMGVMNLTQIELWAHLGTSTLFTLTHVFWCRKTTCTRRPPRRLGGDSDSLERRAVGVPDLEVLPLSLPCIPSQSPGRFGSCRIHLRCVLVEQIGVRGKPWLP